MTSINTYESVLIPEEVPETKKGFLTFLKGKKLPQFHFKLKKKHIAVASLAVMLASAVYVNYLYANGDLENFVAAGKKYGDSILVGKSVDGDEDAIDVDSYFSEARMSRKQSRDEAVATIQNMAGSADITDEQMAQLTLKAESIAANTELESKIESRIKAIGCEDCVVYISGEYADVMVETDGLIDTEAALIKEAIIQETSVPVENISIVEVNP